MVFISILTRNKEDEEIEIHFFHFKFVPKFNFFMENQFLSLYLISFLFSIF